MRSSRIHRAPLLLAGLFTVVVGAGGATGVYYAAERRQDSVTTVEIAPDVLTPKPADGPAQNYLIVGSDSRANFDPEGSGDPGCKCSDTLMILRNDPDHGARLLSIPRDLWVDIAGEDREAKINAAYSFGPATVISTVRQELGIPVHHYVEVDFDGFVKLVDEIGGVEICLDHLSKDDQTGMLLQPGCQVVDGRMALAYARSRQFQEFIDEEWVPDNEFDFGRVRRQQEFLQIAADRVLQQVIDDPQRLGNLVNTASKLISVDGGTDVIDAATQLAAAADGGITTYTLAVEDVRRDGQDALELLPEAEPVLDFFRGTGPPPADPESGTSVAESSVASSDEASDVSDASTDPTDDSDQ